MGRTISSGEQKELDFIQAHKDPCKGYKMYVGGYNASKASVRRLSGRKTPEGGAPPSFRCRWFVFLALTGRGYAR